MSTVKSSFDLKDLNINTFNFPSYRVSFIKLGKKDPCTYQINQLCFKLWILPQYRCVQQNNLLLMFKRFGISGYKSSLYICDCFWLTQEASVRDVWPQGVGYLDRDLSPNSDRRGKAIVNCGKHTGYNDSQTKSIRYVFSCQRALQIRIVNFYNRCND